MRVDLLLLAALVSCSEAALWDKVIKTTLGPVKGFKYFNDSTVLKTYFGTTKTNVACFLGIPYAADTGFENRWKAPQPRTPWNETFQATSFGPNCPLTTTEGASEDCLSVNIWTPAKSANAKLPVLVWNQGSENLSNDPEWYGGGMAQRHGIVTVTFNRRDDVLGYLALDELNKEAYAENGHYSSGNYGVLDHLALLKWVKANIAKFGGDPSRVTIAGQSFGSSQVYHAVNSYLFKGLFIGAIAQSGIRYPYDTLVAGLATSYQKMDLALEYGRNYSANLNVSTLAELRKLPLATVLIGSNSRMTSANYNWITALETFYPLVFKPVLDGYVLPMRYIDQLLSGPANDVPLITGNTKDESGASTSTNYTVEEYTYYQTLKYGNLSDEYFKLYPAGDSSTTASEAWNAQARDTSLVSSWAYARDWVLHSNATSPIYTYYWDHTPGGSDRGAYHMSDIMYTLNALYANVDNSQYSFTWKDWNVQDVMSAYWANFVKTQNPNKGGSYAYNNLTHWYPNDGKSDYVMHVGDGWGNHTLTNNTAQIKLILDYFAQQTPF